MLCTYKLYLQFIRKYIKLKQQQEVLFVTFSWYNQNENDDSDEIVSLI